MGGLPTQKPEVVPLQMVRSDLLSSVGTDVSPHGARTEAAPGKGTPQ